MGKKISIGKRQIQYQEKYKRDFPRNWFWYCMEPLEDIEGWAEMLNDTSGKRWHLHHRDEIQSNGVVVSRDELKCRGELYNLPASKLIFMTKTEHVSLHKSGEHNPMYGHNKYDITEEDLYKLYVVQGLTQQEIGDKIGCGQVIISVYLKKFGIRKQDV